MVQDPKNETTFLSLHINIICVLAALVGVTLIVQHPSWFGRVPAANEQAVPYAQ